MSTTKLKKMGLHGCCNRQMIKRGLWSPEEDEKLIKYMNTYRHTSWSVVPKIAGLQRCGKSCRLRWMNYLRPDLKRGAFTTHEAKSVLELHKIFGNKWSQIAKFLEGRTDNEVKNFWNSTVKNKIFNHRKHKINASRHHQNMKNLMMLQNPQPTSSQMLPVVAIFNDPIDGNKIPIMLNPSSSLMTNKHIITSPPLVPLYTTASAMTITSPPQAVPLFQFPEPSSTIFNHGQQQIITDNVHELADSSITGRGIFGQERELGDKQMMISFKSSSTALGNRNRNPPPELDDHLGFGTNETMAVEDSSDGNSLLFDQLVNEIHERGREVQFMLNNLTVQERAFPHVDPNADEVFHEINNGNRGGHYLKAHDRVHPNHIDNIESLMASFAPAVNYSAASGVNPSTQATTTQIPNDGDGNYNEHPYHLKNCYGSIWGSQP